MGQLLRVESLMYVITAVVFLFCGYLIRKKIAEGKLKQAEVLAEEMLSRAQNEAETLKKEKLLEAKEENHQIRAEWENENKETRKELKKFENRLLQKEESIEKRVLQLDDRDNDIVKKYQEVKNKEARIDDLKSEQEAELERIANLSSSEARELILTEARQDVRRDISLMIKEEETKAKETANKKAREIISYAIQKCSTDHVAESTVSVVTLPNEEMKGRIIGREGRNIRALESATGVDFIIDDTPEAVVLSAFDPIRREIARLSLEKLISDGRIHPARIEETVKKAKLEIEDIMKEEGEKALDETGVFGVHPDLVKLLGRLHFRTSYGQNVLKHSIEISHLCGIIAAELGANPQIAKRAGLLHDIGKAVDHEIEGTHIEIGMDILRRYKEPEEVIHAMSTHHGDFEPETVEAVIVTAADAISASRPGARGETLESYIKRLEKLEEISNSFDGIEKSYAIQAGREIRIMVKPEEIDDDYLPLLAKEITKKIENEMAYPGQIKVNIIRETRAIDYAR